MDLEKEYTTPSKPGAHSGRASFIRELKKRKKNVNVKNIKEWIESEETYTLHKPIRKKIVRNKIIVSGIDDTFQMDLIDMSNLSEFNDSFRFLLSCIDVFSKYAWVIPIKNKSAEIVLNGVKEIFSDGRIPARVQTDEGNEFLNKTMKKYLLEKKVKLYILNSEMKASIVERFNRTIKEKMWRYFTHHQTYRYIDILSDLVLSYNNTFHRTIKIAPSKVNKLNETEIWENIYGFSKNDFNQSDIKFKFKIGDLVRISKAKNIFEKGYTANWTREIFKIHERIPRVPPVYKLIDIHSSPEIIEGIFYEQQLQKISKTDEIYYVQQVVKKRKNKGKSELLIKWLGYPEKFNSWITEADIVKDFGGDTSIPKLDTIKQNEPKNSRIEFSV